MAYPLDVVIKGMNLNDFGFIADGAVSGVALNTFGFLTPCSAIWSPSDSSIKTTWVNCVGSSGSIEVCVS